MKIKTLGKVGMVTAMCFASLAMTSCSPTNAHAQTTTQTKTQTGSSGWEVFPKDKNGVIMVNYGGTIGTQYNPTTISQYAQSRYSLYEQTKNPIYKTEFMAQINWLETNYKQVSPTMIAYPYPFPWPNYNLPVGWYSGLAQGQAMEALMEAYTITHNKKLLTMIPEIKNLMLLPVSKGGLLRNTPEGGPVDRGISEQATEPGTERVHVRTDGFA